MSGSPNAHARRITTTTAAAPNASAKIPPTLPWMLIASVLPLQTADTTATTTPLPATSHRFCFHWNPGVGSVRLVGCSSTLIINGSSEKNLRFQSLKSPPLRRSKYSFAVTNGCTEISLKPFV